MTNKLDILLKKNKWRKRVAEIDGNFPDKFKKELEIIPFEDSIEILSDFDIFDQTIDRSYFYKNVSVVSGIENIENAVLIYTERCFKSQKEGWVIYLSMDIDIAFGFRIDATNAVRFVNYLLSLDEDGVYILHPFKSIYIIIDWIDKSNPILEIRHNLDLAI